jgi:hypothetical protein
MWQIGETGRPLAVRLREHRHNLKGLLEKSKLAQHAYEVGHRVVVWDEARTLEIESSHRKYKELAHMACLKNRSANPV